MVAAAIVIIAAITTADRRRAFHCDQCVSVAHQLVFVILSFNRLWMSRYAALDVVENAMSMLSGHPWTVGSRSLHRVFLEVSRSFTLRWALGYPCASSVTCSGRQPRISEGSETI